jgi:hypothetical protein
MADVKVTIRIDGGLMPMRALDQMMRGQDVTVTGRKITGRPGDDVERRGIAWSTDTQAAVATLVVNGAPAAIRAALALFRKQFPKATIDAKDDEGTPFGYLQMKRPAPGKQQAGIFVRSRPVTSD